MVHAGHETSEEFTDTNTSDNTTSSRASARRRAIIQLLTPTTLALALFFVVPLLWMFRMSFNYGETGGLLIPGWTMENYQDALTDDFYLGLIWRTLRYGALITILTLIVSYPIALFLARTQSKWRGLLMALAIAPLLTSTVVRTYGWLVILGNDGLVNSALLGIGLIDSPIRLVNDSAGVIIGLVEILMPFMILGLLSGFGRVNPALEQAAMSLGAGPFRTFFRVTLPLSLPGIATGCLLVFVLAISSFVTPRLMGGGRVFLLATEVYDQAMFTLNWPFAAALSFILLLLFGVVIVVYLRILRGLERQ